MFLNQLSKAMIISLQCGLMISVLWLDGTFPNVGYAEKPARSLHSHQFGKPIFSDELNLHPSFSSVVCSQKQKTDCQSKPLSVEKVKLDELVYGSMSPYSLMTTSLPPPQKEFLNIEIYVDRQHRNFQDEIIEIFDQSVVRQNWQKGVPILMECYCDDRETLAYSFILGHNWGKRAKAYLQNLAVYPPRVDVFNYGKEYGSCPSHSGECQDADRLQAAFRFLAIGKSHSGCLLRLKLPSQIKNRRVLFEEHPTFLQKIHVAGVWSRQIQ